MFTIQEILDLAVQIEKNGEKIYREAHRKINIPSVSETLERLADEENKHVSCFSELKGSVRNTTGNPELQKMGESILLGTLGDQSFSLKETDFSRLKQIKDLFKVAIEFEKDTVVFYEMIASLLDDTETLNQLHKIIEEENRHIKLFENMLNAIDL